MFANLGESEYKQRQNPELHDENLNFTSIHDYCCQRFKW